MIPTMTMTRAASAALLAALATAAAMPSSTASAAEPFGTWLTEDGRARVRTERCGSDPSRLCGFIVWGSKPLDENGQPKVDRYNPNPGKQARPQLGHQMLLGLKLNDEGHYEGKIYNADNGKSYDVSVWSDQASVLTVKGCMLVFCASQTWKRVADLAPGQLQGATDTAGGPRSDTEFAGRSAAGSGAGRKPNPADGSAAARSR